MAAKHTTVSRYIGAPPNVVWALLTDADSYTNWNPAVIRITGPIVAGGTIELVSVVNPKRTFKLEVSQMTAPTEMVWSDGMPLGLFKGVRTYQLIPSGTGTEFSMTEVFSGALSGLICKSIPDMTDSFNEFADGLKVAAERSATADPTRSIT